MSAPKSAAKAPMPPRERLPTRRPDVERHPELPALVASGLSYGQIAERIGCNRETVAQWARLPHIAAEVERIRRDIAEETEARVRSLAPLALDVLVELAEDRRAPAAVRRQAASDLLDRFGQPAARRLDLGGELALRSDDELRARLRALEDVAARLDDDGDHDTSAAD